MEAAQKTSIQRNQMKAKSKGRLTLHEKVELTLRGLTVWAYTRRGKLLGKVEINRAGLKAITGKKAGRVLGNMRWETFFKRLEK
jgi:hypothetical protein